MTLRSANAYRDAAWDWAIAGPLPRGTRISDVDGIYELDGRLLLIEAKRMDQAIERGQRMVYDAVVNHGIHVLILYGNPSVVQEMMIWGHDRRHATNEDFRNFMLRWAAGK